MKEQCNDIEIKTDIHIDDIEKEGDVFHVTFRRNNAATVQTYDVDAVVVCTGFDLFKAERKQEYGYGIYNNVITNVELERYFKTHRDERIDEPRRIGFVHCVGSRDVKVNNTYCSKVCCATALKQACEIKDEFPESDVYCFYMDLRGRMLHAIGARPESLTPSIHPKLGVKSRHQGLHRCALHRIFRPYLEDGHSD